MKVQNPTLASRARRLLRRALIALGYRVGLCALFDRLNRYAARVLTYHGICDDGCLIATGTDIEESVFRNHIAWLSSRYRLVAADAAGQAPNTIAVSFDDGLGSDFDKAAPVLEACGAPGTFFVCADLAAGDPPGTWHDLAFLVRLYRDLSGGADLAVARDDALAFAAALEREVREKRLIDPYALLEQRLGGDVYRDFAAAADRFGYARFRAMTAAEILTLHQRGHRIGSHSRRHRILAFLAAVPDALLADLHESRVTLSGLVGSPIDLLAYPYGGAADVGQQVENAARDAGYRLAFYNSVSARNDSHRMGRLQVPTRAHKAELYAVSSGLIHFLKTGRLLPRAVAQVA